MSKSTPLENKENQAHFVPKSNTKFLTGSKIFFVISLSFLAGAFAASFFEIEKSFLLLLLAGAIAILAINYQNKKTWLILAAVVFFALGTWGTNTAINAAKSDLASNKTGPVEFVGMVIREPEAGEKNQKIIVGIQNRINSSLPVYWYKNFLGSEEKILINADIYPIYEYGDELKINCVLQEPENYGDSNFDYRMYLAKDGIYRVCAKPQMTLLAKGKGNKIYSSIIFIKNKFEEKLSAIFPDPEGAYLKGLLLGGSARMTKDISEAFRLTGTTHTVAVSGYNVTIVAAFLMGLGIFLGLWRQQVFSFALVGIVLFVVATGAPASAVRAGIMGSLIIWAMKEGRLANSENAILCAGSLMLAANPLLLRYDAGFQLSFLATLGIVYLSPLFEKYFGGKENVNIIKETIFLSIAAQIFVLPIILENFENLSLVSPLANLLILPAIPYIMFGGFAAGIAGAIFVPLGKIIGFVPFLLLKFELMVVQWLANLPWASLEIKNFGWIHISVYYVIIFGALFYYRVKYKNILKTVNEK